MKTKRIKIVIAAVLTMVLTMTMVTVFAVPATIEEATEVTVRQEHIDLSRKAAAEGMVLMENDGTLPLASNTNVALFGHATINYFRGGGGSGRTWVDYQRNILQGMQIKEDEGKISLYQPLVDFYTEQVTSEEITDADITVTDEMISDAAASADTAVVTIGRASSEGWDYGPSGLKLNSAETDLLTRVAKTFDHTVVVLNVSTFLDTEWIQTIPGINAVLMGWQGGMEGGLATADVLVGDVNPSGKLADTFAESYNNYPTSDTFNKNVYENYEEDIFVGYRYFETFDSDYSEVNYEFGYGLSYTTFDVSKVTTKVEGDNLVVNATVTNTGDVAGKEVVQVYFSAPQGLLGKPGKELAAFDKTSLLEPRESEVLTMSFPISDMSSYDDTGKVQKSAYVMEAGDYKIYVGTSVKDAGARGVRYTYNVTENTVTEQLTEQCAPTQLEKRLLADGSYENLTVSELNNSQEPIVANVESTEQVELTSEEKIMLLDVYNDRTKMSAFLNQISDEQLIVMMGGQPSTGSANTGGMGNLYEYGIPNVMTADGPQGIRLGFDAAHTVNCTAWPITTHLACTWDLELVEEVAEAIAVEANDHDVAIWLAPGMNIHRDPLCGRNFEYISEDPFLTGKIAAALTRGCQSKGVAVALKHFAANNKETSRDTSDSRVSERALREIYLKGFEIAVKEADPWSIMSSYNSVNGVETCENTGLLTNIARGEWGYNGIFMTDWHNNGDHALSLLAGTDVQMKEGDPERLQEALEDGTISRANLETSAERLVNMILKLQVFQKNIVNPTAVSIGENTELKIAEHMIWSETVKPVDTDGGQRLDKCYVGAWAECWIDVETAGTYDLSAYVYNAAVGAFDVIIDGEKVATFGALGDSYTNWKTLPAQQIQLEAGRHTLRVEFTETGSSLYWLGFNPTVTE